MRRQFLSYLAVGSAVSAFVACGSDDDEDDVRRAQTSGTTTQTNGFITGSGGSTNTSTRGPTGSGGAGANSDTTGTATGGAAAADGTTSSGGAGGEGGMAGMAGMAGAAALIDEEILHVARTANIGEVEQAQIAVMRSGDPLVLDFAEMMVQEHTSAIAMAQSLAAAEDLPPESNPISLMLQAESAQIIGTLQSASAEEFDLVYMESQVIAHEEVLTLLEDILILQTDNPALETYLSSLRTHVSDHLASAESIVETLE